MSLLPASPGGRGGRAPAVFLGSMTWEEARPGGSRGNNTRGVEALRMLVAATARAVTEQGWDAGSSLV